MASRIWAALHGRRRARPAKRQSSRSGNVVVPPATLHEPPEPQDEHQLPEHGLYWEEEDVHDASVGTPRLQYLTTQRGGQLDQPQPLHLAPDQIAGDFVSNVRDQLRQQAMG